MCVLEINVIHINWSISLPRSSLWMTLLHPLRQSLNVSPRSRWCCITKSPISKTSTNFSGTWQLQTYLTDFSLCWICINLVLSLLFQGLCLWAWRSWKRVEPRAPRWLPRWSLMTGTWARSSTLPMCQTRKRHTSRKKLLFNMPRSSGKK